MGDFETRELGGGQSLFTYKRDGFRFELEVETRHISQQGFIESYRDAAQYAFEKWVQHGKPENLARFYSR